MPSEASACSKAERVWATISSEGYFTIGGKI